MADHHPSFAARIVDVIILVLLGFGIYFVAQNKWAISDWWALRGYQPSPEAVSLASEAGMNDYGRRLFYRGDPKLVASQVIGQVCGSDVIGCITEEGKIFILQDNNGRYRDEIVTTAAHEMLHLAYRRFGKGERSGVDAMTSQALAGISDPKLIELVNTSDHAEAADEIHSAIGTTKSDLPSNLETHYSQYFSDRSQVVAAYMRSQN